MNHRDSRQYYADPTSQYTPQYGAPTGDYSSNSAYPQLYDYQSHPSHYYANQTSDAHSPTHPTSYYRSMTPGPQSHRHSQSASGREYYSPTGLVSSSSSTQQQYNAQDYYSTQYPNENRSSPYMANPNMGQGYTNYPHTMSSSSSTIPPDQYTPGMTAYPGSMLPQPPNSSRPSRITTLRPRTMSGATPPTSATSPTGERFPCEKCGKTFSRSHDRKRHHETQHLPQPVIHRCRFCEKEFSRADSLKRHLDNGCDEMPQ